jgi:YfiR/HmsC-like
MRKSHGITRRDPGHSAGLAALALASLLAWVPSLLAQDPKPTEYQVKAIYLFNFGRFVEWPASITTPRAKSFAVCVLGQDPFGAALDAALSGEMINLAPVVARRIPKPEEAVNCRVLFISSSESSQLGEVLASLDKRSVLTVSDMPQFAKRGGMVQFLLDGNRVRFEVNLDATQRVGLNLSSDLLKLAIAVRRAR